MSKNKIEENTAKTNINGVSVIDNNIIRDKIIVVRDKPVILDRDVAEIYGVETKEINQAVSRNTDKFPSDFMFEINTKEKNELVTNCDRFDGLKHSTVQPKVFTEQGLYMLATILKSKKAIETTMLIIRTFTELRDITRNLDNAGNAKSEKEMGGYLGNAVAKLSNLLINNLEADTTKVKTTLELNLGIARAKIETESIKENKKIKSNKKE
jgi:hypothetical protein